MAPVFRRRLVTRAHRHRPGRAIALVSLLTATVVACGVSAHEAAAQANGDAAVRADFRQRLDRYIELRDTLQNKGLQPEQTADVGEHRASQRALALRIGAGRRDARQGDILTPAIAAMLRSALNPEVRGAGAAGTRASIRDDAPTRFALHVNDRYPDGASRSTVPGNVLEVLPPLPDGLEYRVVDNHLILLDVDAAVVLDYLFNVMCARC